jgi:hypothetical protein
VRRRIRNTGCLLKPEKWETDYRRHRALSRHMSGLEPDEAPTIRQRTAAAFRAVRASTMLARSRGGWAAAASAGRDSVLPSEVRPDSSIRDRSFGARPQTSAGSPAALGSSLARSLRPSTSSGRVLRNGARKGMRNGARSGVRDGPRNGSRNRLRTRPATSGGGRSTPKLPGL